MKLVRVGAVGAERPGLVLADGGIADLGGVIPDVAGAALSPESLDKLRKLDVAKLPRFKAGERLGACVGSVGKFIAIGLNYADHAAETGANGSSLSSPPRTTGSHSSSKPTRSLAMRVLA